MAWAFLLLLLLFDFFSLLLPTFYETIQLIIEQHGFELHRPTYIWIIFNKHSTLQLTPEQYTPTRGSDPYVVKNTNVTFEMPKS